VAISTEEHSSSVAHPPETLRRQESFLARHGLLILLMLTYAVATMDRQVLAILQEPIKQELRLTDSELGLLTGFSFTLFYSLFGMLVGRLVDRFSRRAVIIVSLLAWSAMTVLTSAAHSFLFLMMTRMGVAIGEAGVVPSSASIISDRYSPRARAAAMSFLFAGVPLGMLFGFYLGGRIEHLVGWRTTFLLAGIPGAALALAAFPFVRDPPRITTREPIRLAAGLKRLAQSRVLRLFALATPLSGMVSASMNSWGASYLIRTFHLSIAEVGAVLGLAFGVGGLIGSFGTGLLADRLASRNVRWYAWILALISAGMAPLILASLLASQAAWAIAFLILPCAFGIAFSGCVVAVVNVISPPQFRGTATALAIVTGNLGTGLGAWLIGGVSDLLAPTFGSGSVKYALIFVVPATALIAAVLYARAAVTLPAELARGE
jgi:predicted MFS family arabinose efflux permease